MDEVIKSVPVRIRHQNDADHTAHRRVQHASAGARSISVHRFHTHAHYGDYAECDGAACPGFPPITTFSQVPASMVRQSHVYP